MYFCKTPSSLKNNFNILKSINAIAKQASTVPKGNKYEISITILIKSINKALGIVMLSLLNQDKARTSKILPRPKPHMKFSRKGNNIKPKIVIIIPPPPILYHCNSKATALQLADMNHQACLLTCPKYPQKKVSRLLHHQQGYNPPVIQVR